MFIAVFLGQVELTQNWILPPPSVSRVVLTLMLEG